MYMAIINTLLAETRFTQMIPECGNVIVSFRIVRESMVTCKSYEYIYIYIYIHIYIYIYISRKNVKKLYFHGK